MMVIGANLGTTSTAVISVLGATPNAKRAAAAHVLFNLITAAVAILILPGLMWFVAWLGERLVLGSEPAVLLALFHTVFNVLGVIIMWPITRRMVASLETRFRAAEEDEAQPKYLDDTVAGMPALAQQALAREISRIAGIARRMAADATSTEASLSERLQVDQGILIRLVDAVDAFTAHMREGQLPSRLAERLPQALSATRYFKEAGDLAAMVDAMQSGTPEQFPPDLASQLARFRGAVVGLIASADAESPAFDAQACSDQTQLLAQEYEQLKFAFLHAGTRGGISVRTMVETIELLKTLLQLAQQMVKGGVELDAFSAAKGMSPGADEREAEAA